IVQIDAAPERIGATYEAVGLVGDARAVLAALVERVPRIDRGLPENTVTERIESELEAQAHELERGLLRTIREALPRDAVHAWAFWLESPPVVVLPALLEMWAPTA